MLSLVPSTKPSRNVHPSGMDNRSKLIPEPWSAKVEIWCSMRAQGLSRDTVALRRSHLAQLARAVGGTPETISLEEVLVWLGSRSWAKETRRAHRSSQRRFFTFIGRADLAERLPQVKPSSPMPKPIPEHALRSALLAADDRVRLALRLAAELGLRRREIVAVHASDVGDGPDGPTLLVHGKGDKERIIPMTPALAAMIRLGCGGGFAFPGEYRQTGHMSPAWIGKLAGRVLPAPWTLHKLRHRFATVVNDETGDLVVVQQLLGHASLATTQLYVAPNRDRMRAGVLAAAA